MWDAPLVSSGVMDINQGVHFRESSQLHKRGSKIWEKLWEKFIQRERDYESDDFDVGGGGDLFWEGAAGEQGDPAVPPSHPSPPSLLHLVLLLVHVLVHHVQQDLFLLLPLGEGEENHGEEDDEKEEGRHLIKTQ